VSLSGGRLHIIVQEGVMNHPRETRIHTSLLAAVEKRGLVWIAQRLPRWVGSDHLTAVGAVGMLGAGLCYWAAASAPLALFGVVVLLTVNWFGDSLDGTLARVRHQERPRYGFYVDHVLDAVGLLCLIGGLMLGGFMSAGVGAALLVAYYMLTNEIALATHALGTFRLSFWKFGPTELRILIAIGTLQAWRDPLVTIAQHRVLLFDAGGAVAVAGLLVTFAASAIANTIKLYRAEPLPPHEAPHPRYQAVASGDRVNVPRLSAALLVRESN
jgi:phosphatidylglycerophosphate synthase